MLETYIHANNYKNAKVTCKKAYDKPLRCRPPFNKVIYIVSEKLHMSRGRRRDKKTANNKIVTLMRREKQTNTSVYVSTQKQRHKLNILGTLKLADCMDIKYIIQEMNSLIQLFILPVCLCF